MKFTVFISLCTNSQFSTRRWFPLCRCTVHISIKPNSVLDLAYWTKIQKIQPVSSNELRLKLSHWAPKSLNHKTWIIIRMHVSLIHPHVTFRYIHVFAFAIQNPFILSFVCSRLTIFSNPRNSNEMFHVHVYKKSICYVHIAFTGPPNECRKKWCVKSVIGSAKKNVNAVQTLGIHRILIRTRHVNKAQHRQTCTIFTFCFKLCRCCHHHQWQQWPAVSCHCTKTLWIKWNVYRIFGSSMCTACSVLCRACDGGLIAHATHTRHCWHHRRVESIGTHGMLMLLSKIPEWKEIKPITL